MKNLIEGYPLLIFAALLDFFQLMIGIGTFAISEAPNGVPLVGTAVAAVTGPIGMIIGVVIDMCLTFCGGTMLITLLYHAGFFRARPITVIYFLKIIPFVDLAPSWTFMTWRCISKKKVVLPKTVHAPAIAQKSVA
jgi:hypothetical protein